MTRQQPNLSKKGKKIPLPKISKSIISNSSYKSRIRIEKKKEQHDFVYLCHRIKKEREQNHPEKEQTVSTSFENIQFKFEKKSNKTHENFPKTLKPISIFSSSMPELIKDNFLP